MLNGVTRRVRGMARDGGQPMSMSKCSIGLLLVTLLCAAGCTHLPWRRTPPDYEGPPPTQAYAGKLPVDQASEASSAAMTDTDRQAMLEVIDQLQSISGLTQDERQQLMADLRRTKPSLWPAMVQQFTVEPNEFSLERPYIEHNIRYTREAYQLDGIVEQNYAADGVLNQSELAEDADVLRNVRLWDYRPLLRTYSQLQEIRLY